MKALVIGAGGVGRAIANIASRRSFIESMVIADRTLARAEEAVARVKDPAFLLRWLMLLNLKILEN